jgi:hypothetical protein
MTSGFQIRKLGATRCCKTFANEQACFTSEEIFLYSVLFAAEFLSMPTDRQNVSLPFCQDMKCIHVVLNVKEKSLYDSCCSCGGDSAYGVMGHWPCMVLRGTGHVWCYGALPCMVCWGTGHIWCYGALAIYGVMGHWPCMVLWGTGHVWCYGALAMSHELLCARKSNVSRLLKITTCDWLINVKN